MDDYGALLSEAEGHMMAGIPLLAAGRYAECLPHFEKAAGLRGSLPWRENGHFGWLAAAAWLNLGDAIRGLGDVGRLPEAIAYVDLAIGAMEGVPLEKDPQFVDRLILAWINRGTLCGEVGRAEEAFEAFAGADALFVKWGAGRSSRRIFLRSMLQANRARGLAEAGRGEEAWREAERAVAGLRKLELSMEVGGALVQGRSIQCRALAMLLDEPGGVEKVGDWIAVATDAAEEALALAKTGGFRGEWLSDLVRYGARIYEACQPHFLGEFLVEWAGKGGPLEDDERLREEMRNLLWLAIAKVEQGVLRFPQDTGYVERQVRVLASLQRGLAAMGGDR